MTEPCGAQGFNIGDELLGGGMLVKDLTAVFELCKAVWPEGITCACSIAHATVIVRVVVHLHAAVFSPFSPAMALH